VISVGAVPLDFADFM